MPRWLSPVERQPRKLYAAGSNPARGSIEPMHFEKIFNTILHLIEIERTSKKENEVIFHSINLLLCKKL